MEALLNTRAMEEGVEEVDGHRRVQPRGTLPLAVRVDRRRELCLPLARSSDRPRPIPRRPRSRLLGCRARRRQARGAAPCTAAGAAEAPAAQPSLRRRLINKIKIRLSWVSRRCTTRDATQFRDAWAPHTQTQTILPLLALPRPSARGDPPSHLLEAAPRSHLRSFWRWRPPRQLTG